MTKYTKSYHKTVGNKVASLYLNRVLCKQEQVFTFYDDEGHYFDPELNMTTKEYSFICICVSKSTRTNNDWYKGRKNPHRWLDGKMTGNLTTYMSIVNMLIEHITNYLNTHEEFCGVFIPADGLRREAYKNTLIRFMWKCRRNKKLNLSLTWITTDNDEIVFKVWKE